MKKLLGSLLPALVLSVLLAPAAVAKERIITLINKSGVTFFHLHISPVGKKAWVKDYLDNIVEHNESVQIEFTPSSQECRYDMLVHDQDGKEFLWSEVDLCKRRVILHAGQKGLVAETP